MGLFPLLGIIPKIQVTVVSGLKELHKCHYHEGAIHQTGGSRRGQSLYTVYVIHMAGWITTLGIHNYCVPEAEQ